VKAFLQAPDETIVINGDIIVTVLKIEGDEVLLEIDVPEWMSIDEVPLAQVDDGRDMASLPAR
jgi:sRNA-binding carbon storage regulator CsrA